MFASVFVSVLLVTLLPIAYWFYVQFKFKKLASIPGPKPQVLFGNKFPKTPNDTFNLLLDYTRIYGNLVKIWIGPFPHIFVSKPEVMETILSSNEHITKSWTYSLVKPWLGDKTLLVMTGSDWKNRRRMLTPAFHFQILDKFMKTFIESCDHMTDKMESCVGKTIDIYDFVTLHTLDIICETSMGTKLNALGNSDNQYVNAVMNMLKIFGRRYASPWKRIEWLFVRFADDSKDYLNYLNISHAYTQSVVIDKMRDVKENGMAQTENLDGSKKKVALIDTLVKPENRLSMTDIEAEVSTFMFEGHDTTSSGISFSLYAIANNPHVQDKLMQEIETFAPDSSEEISTSTLNDMKYLDLVIKETQRIYPSVPLIERLLEKDFVIDGVTYPKGTTLSLFIYAMHNDPNVFPNPEVFDPERFDVENSMKRHKFAYTPFSAGPRNCIGQKFALYEMKTTIIKVLQKYKLSPAPGHELKLSGITGVLKSLTGIKVHLERR